MCIHYAINVRATLCLCTFCGVQIFTLFPRGFN